MIRLALTIIAVATLLFSGCAENGSNDDGSLAELGAQCELDRDCRRGVCSNDVCAMASQDCDADDDCLSWEFCDNGACADQCALMGVCAGEADCERGQCVGSDCSTDDDCLNWEMCMGGSCTDPCVLVDCAEGFTCERGQCVENQPCDDGQCEACEDLMDCDAYSVCEEGVCVSNGDCEPWFTGWFVNAAGECEEGGKSGCSYPFDFSSQEDCEASLNSGALTECPDDSDVFFDGGDRPTAAKDLRCEYGQECCCGECHPSTVCHAQAGETFSCLATDACMIPGCGCSADSDCEIDEACEDGFCQDACAAIDCAQGYLCEHGECVPAETCTAYWEGAEHIGGQCVARNGSGCSNPFPYVSVAACCDEHPDAGNCESAETCTIHEDCSDNYYYCEEGLCVHNGDCDAEFNGWYVDGNGECSSGVVSGCESPFPYQSEQACCQANEDACEAMGDEEKTCVEAGGDWELFNNSCVDRCGTTDQVCARVLTMGCDCGPDACWNGEGCVSNEQGVCRDDSDCDYGTVCESDRDGSMVCVTGCHEDSDCGRGQSCNTDIVCVTAPCPGLCEPLAQNNCGDLSCDADVSYCQKSYGGAPPPEGSGITYACLDLPTACVDGDKVCECLTDGPENIGMDCSIDASGLATVSVYLP